jgi:hypothetical protein
MGAELIPINVHQWPWAKDVACFYKNAMGQVIGVNKRKKQIGPDYYNIEARRYFFFTPRDIMKKQIYLLVDTHNSFLISEVLVNLH